MKAVEWLGILLGAYVLISAVISLWPKHIALKAGAEVKSVSGTTFLLFLMLASGALILLPKAVFRYGYVGLGAASLIPVLTLVLAFLLFGRRAQKHSFLERFGLGHHSGFFWKIVILCGSVWLLSWQVSAASQIITALTGVDFIERFVVLLLIALFLLLFVNFGGGFPLPVNIGMKLFALILFCLIISGIFYAYMGSIPAFLGHIRQLYQIPPDIGGNVFQDPVLLITQGRYDFIFDGLFLAGYSLLLASLVGMHSQKHWKNSSERGLSARVVKLVAVFLVLVIFYIFALLLGFGAHFIGANPAYSEMYKGQVSTLLFPLASGTTHVNLPALLLHTLAPIVPFLTGGLGTILLVLLLTSAQVILYYAGQSLAWLMLGLKGQKNAVTASLAGQNMEEVLQRQQGWSYVVILGCVLLIVQL